MTKPPITPKEIRHRIGISIKDAAASVPCSPATMGKFERDALSVSNASAVRLIAWYVNVWKQIRG